ncbi:MAG TPA: CHRD domain-containing protein [Chitinophagaceae bacterium]|nr:CHRD domain-containing protein [Chitinophagaceae bacterium]
MKMNFFSKALSFALLAGTFVIASCDKNDDNDNTNGKMYTVSGNGSGAQVVPVVSTTATSNLTGTYNSGTNQLQYNVSWTGLALTADSVRFYGPASSGVNATGNAQFRAAITTPGVAGSASGTTTLTEAQETDLLAGHWYYTVSNATHLTGEVRGQVTTVAQ